MNFKAAFLLILLSGCACLGAHAGPQTTVPAQKRIDYNLKQIEHCWNQGRMSCMMQYYENSPQTLYTNTKGVIQGWQKINQYYQKSYGTKQTSGKLTLTPVAFQPLGKHFALLIARFKLVTKGQVRTGYTSLIWQQSKRDWKVVSDHSA